MNAFSLWGKLRLRFQTLFLQIIIIDSHNVNLQKNEWKLFNKLFSELRNGSKNSIWHFPGFPFKSSGRRRSTSSTRRSRWSSSLNIVRKSGRCCSCSSADRADFRFLTHSLNFKTSNSGVEHFTRTGSVNFFRSQFDL